MKALLFTIGMALVTLQPCVAGALSNPKDLVPPIRLTRADIYLDGGSLGGTLCDSKGQRFDFFIDLNFDHPTGEIYTGSPSGEGRGSKKPTYEGWSKNDFYSVIRDVFHQQFVWTPDKKSLVPKEPASSNFDGLQLLAAARMLERAERRLKSASKSGQ